MTKYTVLFAEAENDALDDFLRAARRQLGRRQLGKSDVLRAVIRRLSDPAIADAVIAELASD